MTLRLLMVDDSRDDAMRLIGLLQAQGYLIQEAVVDTEDSMRAALNRQEWDLVISDAAIAGFDGMSALTIVRERSPATPFILVTDKDGEERALDVLRHGATDFIQKESPGRLPAAVERALRERRERDQHTEVENALRLAQDRLGSVLASSPAVIFNLRVEGKTISPSWISENIEQLTGYTAGEATAPGWYAAQLHPEDRARALAGLERLLEVGELVQEYRLVAKSGQIVWVRDEMRYLEFAEGEPPGIVGSWTDITERKAIEQQLRQAQKMEAIGQLAGGIAHDFNNFLTVIQMQSYLLLAQEGMPGKARQAVEQVSLAAERAANLTRQLLTFSRKQVVQLQSLDLNEVVANITNMLRRMLGEDIMLTVKLGADLPRIEADTGMVEQALMNLAVNARDAMPRGGQLRITTSVGTHDEHYLELHPQARPGPFVCLSVEDSGCGIESEHMGRLFEPFFSTKPEGQGTGLGLSTVYGIVELHRGWISVYSDVGCGASFRIYLPPAAVGSKAAAGEAAPPPPRGGHEQILLVEDEHELRSLVRCALQSYGYGVHEAQSGPDALRLWSKVQGKIDLLFTDMVMPEGMTGIELAERLWTEKPSLKVICVSGYSAELVKLGMGLPDSVLFLQKPFHSRQLAMTVRNALDSADSRPAPLKSGSK